MPFTLRQRLALRAAEAFFTTFFGFTLRHLRDSCRWHLRGPLDPLLRRDDPFLLAVWHQDVVLFFQYLAIAIRLERRRPLAMLASRSFDGELTARIMRPWGFRFLRGSTGKRGASGALRGLRRALEAGQSAVVVADGPLPPPNVMQPGPIYLARETGVPLYVARAWARPQLFVPRSWFRPILPLPRAHCALFSAGPIDMGGGAEQARLRAESALNALCEQADAHLYLRPRVRGGLRLGSRLRSS